MRPVNQRPGRGILPPQIEDVAGTHRALCG
jgi:hypothetical protein